MKVAATYPDVERLVVDYLTANLDDPATVAVGVPTSWQPGDRHLQVDLDGTPVMDHPITAHSTIRLVGWAESTSEAKALAMRAHGVLLAHPGGDGIAAVRALTGVFPAHDSKTGAEIASVTARVSVRSVEIEPSGS